MARLKFLKDRMAAYGYYLPIDYAKIIGASRAYVSALINGGSIRTEKKFGRQWVKTSVISTPPGGKMEIHYRVIWEIDVWAENPNAAAIEAMKYMPSPDNNASTARCFILKTDDGQELFVDLSERS